MNTENKKILVMGVGTGGINAVNYMIEKNLEKVEFCAVGMDIQILTGSKAPKKVLLECPNRKNGLGAGGNPAIGEKAALESKEKISKVLEDIDMLFLVTGLGGGTGTGATPVIAEIAKEKGIMCVCVATTPFKFEGKVRKRQALYAIEKIKDKQNGCDAIILISNDMIMEGKTGIDYRTTLKDAFLVIDSLLMEAIQVIIAHINNSWQFDVSFGDIENILKNGGVSSFLSVHAREADDINRICSNIKDYQNDDYPIKYAKRFIISIFGNPDIKMSDVKEAIEPFLSYISDDAEVVFSCITDDDMKDEMRLTVIGLDYDKKYVEQRIAKRQALDLEMQEEIMEVEKKFLERHALLDQEKFEEIEKIKDKFKKKWEENNE